MAPGYLDIVRTLQETVAPASPVRVYLENLDFRNFHGPSYEAVLKTYLRDKYRGVPISAMVTLGPSAFSFGLQVRSEQWADVPIVVAAVDQRSIADAIEGPLGSNVTGRSLQLSLARSVEVARALVPGLDHIALVGDPLEEQPFRRYFVEEIPLIRKSLSVIDLTGRKLEEIKKDVARLPEKSAIIYTAMTTDGAGTGLLSYEACEVIASVTNRPIVVDVENRLGHGGAGGSIVQNEVIGKELAEIVVRLLNGESASHIPIIASDAVKAVFDSQQLTRLGISESWLPSNSEIWFREPTAWQQYRWRIVLAAGVLGLQTILILGLIAEDRRRRQAVDSANLLSAELAYVNRRATAGELTASIAHEVRQPLTSIVVAAETGLNWLTRKVPDLDEVKSSLRNIINEGHRVDDVIRNVNAMFKKEPPERVRLDVNVLIEDVVALVARKLQTSNIRLKTDYADNAVIRGNPVQLQQVVMNLIANAIEAMSEHKGYDRILQIKTEVTSCHHVSIAVQDSGSGIKAASVNDVFKPFFSTKSDGIGMGLAICKTIIDAHGGQLTVTSGERSGTTFKVVLPIDKGR